MAIGLAQHLVLLVDPDGPDNIADDVLKAVTRLCLRISGVVDDDRVSTIKLHAARIGECPKLKDARGGDDLIAARPRLGAVGCCFVLLLAGLRYVFVK